MPAKRISEEVLQKTFECWKKHKGKTQTTARELNVSEGTVRFRINQYKQRNNTTDDISEPPFLVTHILMMMAAIGKL